MNQVPGSNTRSLFFAFCVIILFAPVSLKAQGWQPGLVPTETAFIEVARGNDFSLVVGGEQTVVPAEAVREGAIILEPSGFIQTGPGTYLEIRFAPSGAVVKMSGNTAIVYNGIDENGRFADLGLMYGRIRVVSGETGVEGINSVVIRSGAISTRVMDGDIGVDYVFDPNNWNRPVFHLFAFRGSSEIFSDGRAGAGIMNIDGLQVLTVYGGESLSIDSSPTHTFLERRLLETSVIAYWNYLAIWARTPVEPALVTPLETIVAEPEAPAGINLLPVVFEEVRWEQPARNWRRGLLIGTGITMMASALAVQGLTLYQPDIFLTEDFTGNVRLAAFAPLGLGAILTIIGIRHNPSPPAR